MQPGKQRVFNYYQNNKLMTTFHSEEQAAAHFKDQIQKYPEIQHRVEIVETQLVMLYRNRTHVRIDAKAD